MRRNYPFAVRNLFLASTALGLLATSLFDPRLAQAADGALPPGTMAPVASASDPGAPANAPGPGARVLSATDQVVLEEAHRAADRKDWSTARSFASRASDQVAARVIEWRYLLDENSGASFADLSTFLNRFPDWPSRDRLLTRAEGKMPATMTPGEVTSWFGTRDPVTAAGALRLGEALIASGRRDEGAEIIRDAWIENTFETAKENEILRTYGDVLRPDDQRARLIELLADNDINDAQRQIGRVDADARRIAEARITLKSTPGAASSLPASLGATLQNDPWLIYDQARAFRRNGNDSEAWAAMQRAQSPLPNPDSWWQERHIMARDALKVNAYDVSYQIVSQHSMESGGGFADAEFLAGWIALRHRNDPEAALAHFQTLAGGVSFPISRARAYYWMGRAQEELGRVEDARASYERAGSDATTYYGQLALTRLSPAPELVLGADMPAPDRRLDNDERVHAMQALLDVKRPYIVRTFALHLANEERSPGRLRYVADFLNAANDRVTALRVAKLASYNDVMLLPYLDPILPIPQGARRPDVEPALILGLARQESEFDAEATSTAGARGLMQLMPATARQTARNLGVAYRESGLGEPDYNMQLGSAHLSELLARWSGSYVLTIAAYNAGSGNVSNWVETYGDPRTPAIDVIDWIELIPFGETRNYVQRVLENIQVYRARLAGGRENLTILADLARSGAPIHNVPLPQPAPRL
jgi:soluble lytic murein transglycosylase